MKLKGLFIIVFLTLGYSCSNDLSNEQNNNVLKDVENELLSRSDKQLASLLAQDPDFVTLVNKTNTFTQTILNASESKLLDPELREDVQNMNLNDFQTINDLLDLNSSISDDFISEINQLTNKIKDNFPEILDLSETDASDTFKEAYFIVKGTTIMERNSCDKKFQADMHSIHVTYDSSLIVCAAVGLFTGGAGVIPCAAVATGVAIIQTAVAIDAHTQCMQNQ